MSNDTIKRSDAIEAIHREARIAGGSVAIEYADMFQEAIKAIPSADRPQGWIPCSERLPSKSGTYLVTYEWVGQSGTKYTEIEVIDFERGRWSDHTRHYEKVTAWMPLPKPYEEVKENE